MKLRMNRLFSFYRREDRNLLIAVGAVLALLLIVRLVTHELYLWNFLVILLFFVVFIAVMALIKPRRAELHDRQIVVGSSTVYVDVRRISFTQSELEKKFNVGRITFEGKNEEKEQGSRTGFCTLYGVRNFDEAKERMRGLLPADCFD